jgi:hypothetical protein
VIGVMKLISKLWVKFNEDGVECVCNEHARKCDTPICKEYVVKFTEIVRSKSNEKLKEVDKSLKALIKDMKQVKNKISKDINKFKV